MLFFVFNTYSLKSSTFFYFLKKYSTSKNVKQDF